jgi:hypothetical protein
VPFDDSRSAGCELCCGRDPQDKLDGAPIADINLSAVRPAVYPGPDNPGG